MFPIMPQYAQWKKKSLQHRLWIFSFCLSLRIMPVLRFYRKEETGEGRVIRRITQLFTDVTIITELCYNVELDGERMLYEIAMSL